MPTRRSIISLALLGLVSCRDAKGSQDDVAVRPASVVPTATPEASATPGAKDTKKKKDVKKGDRLDDDWVPAEHKAGAARWKDTGVYVDGKAVGFLSWGELPLTVQPTWIKDKVSDRKRPGTNDPGWKWARQRMYKFTDYLKSVDIDIKQIKELHVYSGKLSQTLIATQKDLASPLVDKFMFRFGSNTGGKAIPVVPGGFGNGKSGDKIAAVLIYINKKAPTLVRNEGMELDGEPQYGVPHFGEPIRGGIRIYVDNKLAAIIKRSELVAKSASTDSAGELHWKLADVFKAQGVDTSKIVEGWVIRDERRNEKIPFSTLVTMSFAAAAQGKGGILLGDQKIRTNALALHTRPIKAEEIPQVTPDDD